MNNFVFILTLLTFPLAGFCQKQTTVKDILFLESQISNAVLNNDTAKYASFTTDDFEFSVPEGSNISKRQFLLDMKKFWHPTEINRTEQKVRIHKNVAVVTGLVEFKWKELDKENTAQERYTDTYIYHKSKWLLMVSQSCEEVQKNKAVYENEVKSAVSTLWKAWETGNKSLAEPIYANDFIDTDFEGIRRNKTQVLEFLKPLPNNVTVQISLSDWHFIVKNTTVIVNYIGEDTRTKDGKVQKIKFRATDTYIKKYGHWQIIAGQQILIKND
jgi:ketosteroid isomerase-like protein